MNQKIKLSASIFLLSFFVVLLYSCESTNNIAKGKMVKAEASTNQLFLEGVDIRKDETYSQINGSVRRLHSILCGRFVQYSIGADPEKKKYTTWLINDGQDSVIVYHLPVGESSREGYWMYNCQVMTSLPNQPLHATFCQLKELNRDTISAIYYDVPEKFDVPLSEMLDNPEKAFETINLDKLERMEEQDIAYVRETPIHYRAEMDWYQDTRKKNAGGFMATYFLIRPEMIVFGTNIYDKHKKLLEATKGERLMRNGMVNPNLLK